MSFSSKHSIYEGGFREPFLVRWPGHVPAGTVSEQVIGLVDVFATLADILGVGRPPRGAEDSVSVLRAFTEAKPGPPVRDHVVMQGADATYALRMAKRMFQSIYTPTLEQLLEIENLAVCTARLTHDHKEGIAAFTAKRAPKFEGR